MTKQTGKSTNPNMLTFDIEEWFHANYDYINPNEFRGKGSGFRKHMDTILQLCSDTDSRATFFVLGCIGEDYPDVVKLIAQEGHDVASHGYSHQLAYQQTIQEFQADVKQSIAILEDIVGKPIVGYRAPSWSIVKSNLHYLEVLEELGMIYDASVFPVKTFLYGIPDAPTEIHKPCVNGRELNLYEVPMSVMKLFGRNIGYSGGFYFRLFPQFVIENAIRTANQQGKSAIVYLHPRELDATEQRLSLPPKEAFIHYYHVHSAKEKLESMMRTFCFTSIADHLRQLESSGKSIS